MQLHDVRKVATYRKSKVRVGRGPGSGIGKTSGRGGKGATARSGYRMPPSYAGGQMPLFRRLPKRGFTNAPFKTVYQPVNVGDLAVFPAGSTVLVEDMVARGLASKSNRPIKVLGMGDLPHALTVRAHAFSASAKEKIEKAGGKVELPYGKPLPARKKTVPKKQTGGAPAAKAEDSSASSSRKGKKEEAKKEQGGEKA